MSSQDSEFHEAVAKQHELAVKYKDTFIRGAGADVLSDLVKQLEVDQANFDPDPYRNAYNCGLRDAVCHIRRMMSLADIDPEERFPQQQEG